MTGSRMPLNTCQPLLMTFIRYVYSCIYNVHVYKHVIGWFGYPDTLGNKMVMFHPHMYCLTLQKLSNNTSAQAFLGPENAEVIMNCYNQWGITVQCLLCVMYTYMIVYTCSIK